VSGGMRALHAVNGLFGKDVVVESTGERRAKVEDVVFDREARRVVALLVGDGLLGGRRFVRWEEISGLGDVIVVRGGAEFPRLRDDPELSDLHKNSYKITGTDVIHGGEKIGSVSDILVDDSGAVAGYEVSRGLLGDLKGRRFLPADQVEAAGRDAILARSPDLPPIGDVVR
jgi:uncharacterized protein YrrD